jgi:hypothetical protein
VLLASYNAQPKCRSSAGGTLLGPVVEPATVVAIARSGEPCQLDFVHRDRSLAGEHERSYGRCIDLVSARDEVVGLHDFFASWFTGSLEDAEPLFERLTQVLHPEFTMIVPSGEVLARDAVVASVRAAHSTAGGSFVIEIRDVVELTSEEDLLVCTYEEWQFVDERVDSRRISTVVFVSAPGTVNGVQWRHLHETLQPS